MRHLILALALSLAVVPAAGCGAGALATLAVILQKTVGIAEVTGAVIGWTSNVLRTIGDDDLDARVQPLLDTLQRTANAVKLAAEDGATREQLAVLIEDWQRALDAVVRADPQLKLGYAAKGGALGVGRGDVLLVPPPDTFALEQ